MAEDIIDRMSDSTPKTPKVLDADLPDGTLPLAAGGALARAAKEKRMSRIVDTLVNFFFEVEKSNSLTYFAESFIFGDKNCQAYSHALSLALKIVV